MDVQNQTEIEEAVVVEENVTAPELTEEQQAQKEVMDERQKEMIFFMNLMNDPDSADAMFRNEVQFARFKELFGPNFKSKKCNRKSCERLHLKVKDARFCGKECENIYHKRV